MEEIPKDVLMILDISGSMAGTKINQMKDAVLGILSDLHEGDRFNILKFESDVNFYKPAPVLANKKSLEAAKTYVRSLYSTGGKIEIFDSYKIKKYWLYRRLYDFLTNVIWESLEKLTIDLKN